METKRIDEAVKRNLEKFLERYTFIIIDDNILYHCGASFKDLGKKCFAINRIGDNNILKELQKSK